MKTTTRDAIADLLVRTESEAASRHQTAAVDRRKGRLASAIFWECLAEQADNRAARLAAMLEESEHG